MLNAKIGTWYVDNPQRCRSNNSVFLMRDEVTETEFMNIIESVKSYGEPGFIFGSDTEIVLNPCQPDFATVLTPDGIKEFKDIDVGSKIWSETGWTTIVKKWKTGTKPVYEYKTSIGSFIGTENHRIIQNGIKVEAKDATSIDGFVDDKPIKNSELNKIKEVVYLGDYEVYDITVDNEPHTYWTGGLNVSNCVEVGMRPTLEDGRTGFSMCNLVEINGAKSHTKEIFLHQCKVASIMATLQAGYTDFAYLKDASEEIIKKEALIGVGITGIMNSPDILLDEEILKEGAEVVKYWNKITAKLININPATRSTVIKPSGNSSVLLGSSSGIHPEHAPVYLRHVQMNKNTKIAQEFINNNPEMVEISIWNSEDIVIAFPVEAPDTSIFGYEMKGTKLLNNVKLVQNSWIEQGTDYELAKERNTINIRHNVSNTITVDDWDTVAKFIYDNRYSFCGVSLLSSYGDLAYAQAPFTEVIDHQEIVDRYGQVALFTSALIEDALHAFGHNNLWLALDTAMGYGLTLSDSHEDLEKRDFVRRFKKFATNFQSQIECSNCIKNVYILHKYWKITNNIKNIDFTKIGKKEYTNASDQVATACSGGKCEV